MKILIGILIGVFIIAALSAIFSFLMICGILNFTTQLIIYSSLVAIMSFICIILIKMP